MAYNPRRKLLETRLPEAEFREKLCLALGGGKACRQLVWTAAENEIVVDLDKLQVGIRTGKIVVGLSLECDEFGVQELVVPFVVGDSFENSLLLAVMPKSFGGHQGLARTWGEVVAKFVWQACLHALHLKWQQEDGLDKFQIQGLICSDEMVQGLFAYPEDGEVLGDEIIKEQNVADVVDSLELAQIHLGIWSKGALIPAAVQKMAGRVDTVQFQNGVVMKSAEVAALMKEEKIEVAGVTAVRKGEMLYLRAKPDESSDNNLLNLPPISR